MSISGHDSREAEFFAPEGDKVRCSLCPHSCLIEDHKRGLFLKEPEDQRLLVHFQSFLVIVLHHPDDAEGTTPEKYLLVHGSCKIFKPEQPDGILIKQYRFRIAAEIP